MMAEIPSQTQLSTPLLPSNCDAVVNVNLDGKEDDVVGGDGCDDNGKAVSNDTTTSTNSYNFDSSSSIAQSFARFVDRSGTFKQSKGDINLTRKHTVFGLFALDFFHTILELHTTYVMLMFFAVYILAFLIFAIFYFLVSGSCAIETDTFLSAIYFSVETMVTIGYTTADPFFNQCGIAAFLIVVQSLFAICLDSIVIGFVVARLSRAQMRASSVVFSDKAILQEINGRVYFSFQVCELRDEYFIEAHVQCFAIRHMYDPVKNRTIWFQQSRMRLQQPDDELGGMLMMALPSVVVHHIDSWSPLYPPAFPSDMNGSTTATQVHDPMTSYKFPDLILRDADASSGARINASCKICGSSFRTEEERQLHHTYCSMEECIEDQERTITHNLSSSETPRVTSLVPQSLRARIQQWMLNCDLEVVCIVEGMDPITSDTVQAMHSYTPADMLWNHKFVPCVSISRPLDRHSRINQLTNAMCQSQKSRRREGGLQIDLGRFHDTIPLNEMLNHPVPSHL